MVNRDFTINDAMHEAVAEPDFLIAVRLHNFDDAVGERDLLAAVRVVDFLLPAGEIKRLNAAGERHV